MATRKFRLGILGTGRMANDFAESLAGQPDLVLQAVGSRQKQTADEFAAKHDIKNAHGDYGALVSDSDVDIVYIATPHTQHCQNSLDCIEAGKAVICEKPFTLNADEAFAVISKARRENIFIMEAMWTRFLPAVVRLRELIDENAVGSVQTILAGGAFMPSFDPENYLFNKSLGGGVLLDAGVYLVSMASMVLGNPASICAVGRKGRSGVDENDAMVLGYENGANALLYVSLQAQSSPEMRILGDRGEIHVHAPIFSPASLTLRRYEGVPERLDLPFTGKGYQYQVSHVAECLRAGKTESDIMPLDETMSIMQALDTIRRQIGLVYPQEK